MPTQFRTLLLAAILAVIPVHPAFSAIVYVSKDGDNSTGQSWETAFTTLSHAVQVSWRWESIWVREGEYQEQLDLPTGSNPWGTRFHLFGGFAGNEGPDDFHSRDWVHHPTVISSTGGSYHGPTITAVGIDTVTLDGFIISGGDSRVGGGILCEESTLNLRNCRFTGNLARTKLEGEGYGSEVRYYPAYGLGGGLALRNCPAVTIVDSIFESNEAGLGGGVYAENSTVEIVGSRFRLNKATDGGALVIRSSDCILRSCEIRNCVVERFKWCSVFRYNPVVGSHCQTESQAGGFGGAVYSYAGSSILMENCLLAGNESSGGSDVLRANDSVLSLNSCTIAGATPDSTADFSIVLSDLSIKNSIIDSVPLLTASTESTAQIEYSFLVDPQPGPGNITGDPMFRNPEIGDYRLQLNSPCIDSGTAANLMTDLEGNVRPVDIPAVGFEGTGAFDMGAYEFHFENSDLNQDGEVDSKDLLLFQTEWMRDGN